MQEMYKGIAFSPNAILTKAIGPTDSVIEVSDIDAFPDGPNLATIGTDEFGETILYAQVVDNKLSGCTRGIEGTAKSWQSNEIIARNFTNEDLERLIDNINSLDDSKVDNSKVLTDVPINAKFTDTTYKAGTNVTISGDNTISASGNVDSVNGKTGVVAINKSDIGLSNVDNLSASSIRSGTTKAHVGLGNVDNVKQASKTEFDAHKADDAPHQYGNRFEWRYNSATDSLDLVVFE